LGFKTSTQKNVPIKWTFFIPKKYEDLMRHHNNFDLQFLHGMAGVHDRLIESKGCTMDRCRDYLKVILSLAQEYFKNPSKQDTYQNWWAMLLGHGLHIIQDICTISHVKRNFENHIPQETLDPHLWRSSKIHLPPIEEVCLWEGSTTEELFQKFNRCASIKDHKYYDNIFETINTANQRLRVKSPENVITDIQNKFKNINKNIPNTSDHRKLYVSMIKLYENMYWQDIYNSLSKEFKTATVITFNLLDLFLYYRDDKNLIEIIIKRLDEYRLFI